MIKQINRFSFLRTKYDHSLIPKHGSTATVFDIDVRTLTPDEAVTLVRYFIDEVEKGEDDLKEAHRRCDSLRDTIVEREKDIEHRESWIRTLLFGIAMAGLYCCLVLIFKH